MQNFFKIENGIFQKIEQKPKDHDDRYILTNLVDQNVIYDYDKHRLRPYIRDYIARHGQSIEFTYVKYVLFVSIICLIFSFLGYSGGSKDELKKISEKIDILTQKIETVKITPPTNARPRSTNE